VARQSELSHYEDIERCVERARHLEPDRNAAAREREDHDTVALQVAKATRKLRSGMTSVAVGFLESSLPSHCGSFEKGGAIAMPRWHRRCVSGGSFSMSGGVAMLRNNRALLTGLGLGVGLMYFMDPERGRRRRTLVRDKVAHTTRVSSNALGGAGLDLAHRAAGLLARARGVLRRRPVDDGVLVERVRAKLGRLVSHPHAVDVNAIDGYVRLRGAVLQSEVPRLVRAVARVPGVRDVINALNVHLSADIPALQDGRTPTRSR
jgi:hypothetical protein